MSQSEQVNELAAALAKAQGEIKNPVRDKTANIQTKTGRNYAYSYVDLARVWDAIRKPLSANGLSITQTMEYVNGPDNSAFTLVTTLRHSSGQWVSSAYPLPTGVQPQEFGSAQTYARRYSISALIGVASEEDDDANEAQKAPVKIAKPPPPDTGEPREIGLGDSPDWVYFGQQMIACSKGRDWAEWEKLNSINLSRMENEAPKVHARMKAAINGA